jgi:hypothetical protein
MSIASSAVLVSLNISVWPASKIDREVTDQVNNDALATHDASQTKKNLFAGTHLRKNIEKFAAKCRVTNLKLTLPWADKGDRLLATKLFMEHKSFINKAEAEFNGLCNMFFTAYPQLVIDAPTRLGKLHKPEDYPSLEEVRAKFGFRYVYSPLPEAGDFRLDVNNEELESIKATYEQDFNSRMVDAMREPWERLHTTLVGISEKLTDEPVTDDEGPKRRYHESLITNAQELCGLLTKLNITNDPKLEEARRQLEVTLVGADIEVIKESPMVRESMKAKVDSILSKFDW